MRVFSAAECDVLEAMTTQGFEFSREIAHEVGIDLGVSLIGPREDNPPVIMMLELPAGYVLSRHAHPTRRAEIVVRGSVILPEGRVLRPGDVTLTAAGEFYGPITAGAEGCLTAEFFGDLSGIAPVPAGDNSKAARDRANCIAERTRAHLDSV
jgi:hypothetical protein